jgi:hypothetical protein
MPQYLGLRRPAGRCKKVGFVWGAAGSERYGLVSSFEESKWILNDELRRFTSCLAGS